MSKYFHISTGLRGCYMPDSVYVVRCDTRRDLKAALEYEAATIRDSGLYVGCSKRDIAALAAIGWREARKASPAILPHVAPYRAKGQDHYPYGVFVSVATRREYLESEEEH